MILVCGIMADALIELMCARLEDMNYDYMFLDERQFPGKYDLCWELGENGVTGYVSSPDRRIRLEDITGIYARYVQYQDDTQRSELNKTERAMVEAEYQVSLMQLLDVIPCTVINRARASTSNDSKIYQAFLAERFGLLTPKTLVTTMPDEAAAFYEACGKKVIFKSLSSIRSIVRPMDETDLRRLDRLRNGPTQFQECVEGVDVRVHTVGDEVFPTQIESEASDYRYARRQGASLETCAIELPEEISQACVGMAKSLGLEIAGIDLRRTPDGRWYCFEVNPSPGFIFYECSTGQPISEAVARRLRGH